MEMVKAIARDIPRLLLIIIVGHVLVFFSVPFAEAVHEPAFASWGLFTGGAFFAAAMSHIIRRILFPSLSVQSIAREAILSPTGAGLVFLGISIVTAALFILFGTAIRG